jgi:hypothetical protein
MSLTVGRILESVPVIIFMGGMAIVVLCKK